MTYQLETDEYKLDPIDRNHNWNSLGFTEYLLQNKSLYGKVVGRIARGGSKDWRYMYRTTAGDLVEGAENSCAIACSALISLTTR